MVENYVTLPERAHLPLSLPSLPTLPTLPTLPSLPSMLPYLVLRFLPAATHRRKRQTLPDQVTALRILSMVERLLSCWAAWLQ